MRFKTFKKFLIILFLINVKQQVLGDIKSQEEPFSINEKIN